MKSADELYVELTDLKARAERHSNAVDVEHLRRMASAFYDAVVREQAAYLKALNLEMNALDRDGARQLIKKFSPYSACPEVRSARIVLMQHEALRCETMRIAKVIVRARKFASPYLDESNAA